MPSAVSLRWAVGILAGQTVALVAVVVFLAVADLGGDAGSVRGAVGVTLYAALLALALGGLTWALWKRRSWARGPAIVIELLLLPIGYTMATGGLGWLGVLVMAAGLAGAATLLAPSTRAALNAQR